MSLCLFWDPLFRLPLATGLLLALCLPLLGTALRLRDQWLSSLGVAQVAAAGGVAASLIHLPVIPIAAAAAIIAGLVRTLLGSARNEHYAIMLLAGWATVLMLALFGHHSSTTAELLLNGQIYFATRWQLSAAASLSILLLILGPWLAPRLLVARLFPDHFSANRKPAWPHDLALEALVIVAIVLGIVTMGVMASFAMMFIPPWAAFRLARGWPAALIIAAAIGLVAYLGGFILAVGLDLPFGPTLVGVLLLSAGLRFFRRRLPRVTGESTGAACARARR